MVSGLSVLFGAFFAWQGRKNKIARELRTSGVSSAGTVKSLIVSRGRYGPSTSLEFTFKGPDGQEIVGQSDTLGWRRPNWKEGDPIRVYYNPKKPEQFCVDLDQPASAA